MARAIPPGMTVSPTGWKMPYLRGIKTSKLPCSSPTDANGRDNHVCSRQQITAIGGRRNRDWGIFGLNHAATQAVGGAERFGINVDQPKVPRLTGVDQIGHQPLGK
ncbi:MAG: hypothetical protein R2932_54875 [Caldilineaceae bacterium]